MILFARGILASLLLAFIIMGTVKNRKFEGNDTEQIDKSLHVIPPNLRNYSMPINEYKFIVDKRLILINVGWSSIDNRAHYIYCIIKDTMEGTCILRTKTSYNEFYARIKRKIQFGFCNNRICVIEYKGTYYG